MEGGTGHEMEAELRTAATGQRPHGLLDTWSFQVTWGLPHGLSPSARQWTVIKNLCGPRGEGAGAPEVRGQAEGDT